MNNWQIIESAISAKGIKLKKDSKGFRGSSPLRTGSDSQAFTITPDLDENDGVYYDHVSDESGNFFQLAKLLSVTLQDKDIINVDSTLREYTTLKDYAAAHAVTEDYLNKAGWKVIEHYSKRPAIEFPTATGKRYRFLDGKEPKYISEKGYKTCFYGLDRAIKIAIENDFATLVFCNGEISTLAAQYHNIPAFCQTSGEKAISEILLNELTDKWPGRIIIALDCDDKGRKVAPQIKAQLKDSVIVDFGLSKGGDLADFCKLHTDATYITMLNMATTPKDKTAPTIELSGHETDKHTAPKVLDELTDEITGKTPVKERAYPFAIASMRKYGGYMRNSKSGKVDIFIGGSGTGKTQLLETMDDYRNYKLGISGNFFNDEWSEKEMQMRRIAQYSQPHLTYDQIEDHLMFMGYQQEGVSDADNFGVKFTDAQLETFIKYKNKFKNWRGQTEYFGGEATLDDTIEAMKDAIERRRREGVSVLYTIFDYAQLLRAKGWDSSSSRAEYAFELVKKMASDLIVHVDITSQITKNSSKDAKNGKTIKGEDAQNIRTDKGNGAYTIDRQYIQDGDDYMETPYFFLTSRKSSLSGAMDGEKYPRIAMTMYPERLWFETRTSGLNAAGIPFNWTHRKELAHMPGNQYYEPNILAPRNENHAAKVKNQLDAIPI